MPEILSLSLWLMATLLLVIIVSLSFYFSKKSWFLVITFFLLAIILQLYLNRSDILDDLFGKYIKQEPRYMLGIIEIFGPGIIASICSYYFSIKRFDIAWINITILGALVILNVLMSLFIAGIIGFGP